MCGSSVESAFEAHLNKLSLHVAFNILFFAGYQNLVWLARKVQPSKGQELIWYFRVAGEEGLDEIHLKV